MREGEKGKEVSFSIFAGGITEVTDIRFISGSSEVKAGYYL